MAQILITIKDILQNDAKFITDEQRLRHEAPDINNKNLHTINDTPGISNQASGFIYQTWNMTYEAINMGDE